MRAKDTKQADKQVKVSPSDFFSIFNDIPIPTPRSVIKQIKRDGILATKKGRPSNYTRAIVQDIIKNVCLGLPLNSAAALSGVTAAEVHRWADKYPDFRDCLIQGKAILESALSRSALAGIAKNPKIAVDLLERRFPKDWAQQRQTKHSGFLAHGQVGEIDLDSLSKAREGRDQEIIDAEEINTKELAEGVVPSVANIANIQDVVVEHADADTNKPAPLPLPSEVIDQQPLT